jgi:hypothetical protein
MKYLERIGNDLNIFRFSVKENGGKWQLGRPRSRRKIFVLILKNILS